ncbi:MAG: hypothetical protein AAB359_04490 [Elusimicrobiota bacterium]
MNKLFPMTVAILFSAAFSSAQDFDQGINAGAFIETARSMSLASSPVKSAAASPAANDSGCRPAAASEIPTPPDLPWVTGQEGPWDVLGNGLLLFTYGEASGLAQVKAYHVLTRETEEPKDLAWIADLAKLDKVRAFVVEYPEQYYVYWARPSALFYHVRQKDGKSFRIYRDIEQDGVNGNEEFCDQYVETL